MSLPKKFRFELNGSVTLIQSGELGIVIARAEYVYNENMYFVRYKSADGRAVESWCGESALNEIAFLKVEGKF